MHRIAVVLVSGCLVTVDPLPPFESSSSGGGAASVSVDSGAPDASTLVRDGGVKVPDGGFKGAVWPDGGAVFDLAQTLSDRAQVLTLSFSGLAFLTGNLESQSFFPPGKVADYTGFQYLRDTDPGGNGHNTSFLSRVAGDVLLLLTDAQLAQLSQLAVAQQADISQYGYQRYPLMKAFRRQLDGELPAGSSGLDLEAVKAASRQLYLIDGRIAFDRAVLYSTIIGSFTDSQRRALDAMKGVGWAGWPVEDMNAVRARLRGLPPGTAVAVMTYAGDLFSWYEGSLEADVYFCPERHGTYFGSFYMKDAPAVGHEGYAIDQQLTATAGTALTDPSKGYVTATQAALVDGLLDAQRANLYAGTVNITQLRTDISAELRTLLSPSVDRAAVRARVLALSQSYGELDGANNFAYAMTFARVGQSLTAQQRAKLGALRTAIMSGTWPDGTAFDFSVCSTPWLYAERITDPTTLTPYIGNTDALFFPPP